MKASDLPAVLGLIYSKIEISRTELAAALGLAQSYVGGIVQELLHSGVLVESGLAPSRGGRRRVLLKINPDLAHLLGVDVGTANLRLAITDLLGNVLRFQTIPVEPGTDGGRLLDLLHGKVEQFLKDDGRIKGIGIAHSGVVDSAKGVVLFWPKVQGWRDVPLRALVAEEHHLPTTLEDSVRAMAIAEQRFGLGPGLTNFVYLTIGMGIGSAIFINGKLYTGSGGFAGELGHTTIEENGDLCSCGNRGCLETLASGSAITQRVQAAVAQGAISSLSELRPEQVSVQAIVEAARAHDRLAERLLTEAGVHFGNALANLVNLLNPERIILGGAVPRHARDLFIEPALRTLNQRAIRPALSKLEVLVTALGQEAAAQGAAINVGAEILSDVCARATPGLVCAEAEAQERV